jgi:spore maturation protein CgeB
MIGKPSKGVNTVFYTDPHTGLRGIYDRHENQYDYRYNPQTVYSKPNETYLPYAADSVYHRPMENIEKIYDVCIIGNYYPQRVQLIDRLRALGINCFFQLGLAKEDAQLIMNQSKICVNWSSLDDLTARVFETMGSGTCLVANRVPDLNGLFVEDTEFVGFSSMEEAINKVQSLLANPDKLNEIANNGRLAIENGKHFWDDRLNTILESSNA